MITCAKCGKDNQDHYKFCLGCGAELAKGSAPKPFAPQTPTHGVKTVDAPGGLRAAAASLASTAGGAPVPSSTPATQPVGASAPQCPQCAHVNTPGSRFCASCGFNLIATQSALTPSAGAVAAAPPASAGPAGSVRPVRLTVLRADGTEADVYPLPNEPKVTVGRDTGAVFAGDSYLSPRHASFSRQGQDLTVHDEGSLNGVYLKLKPQEPWALNFGDVFRIGQEIVRLEALEAPAPTSDGVERFGSPREGYVGRLALIIGRDTTGNAFLIPAGGVYCGRERGDILFSEDGYVSGLHCSIAPDDKGQLLLTDVGSSNGTFIRLTKDYTVSNGDILLMGQQLFRVDIG